MPMRKKSVHSEYNRSKLKSNLNLKIGTLSADDAEVVMSALLEGNGSTLKAGAAR